jgi:hypothetical protein
MTDAQSGYLLLADISGYTAFPGDSELEHACDRPGQTPDRSRYTPGRGKDTRWR